MPVFHTKTIEKILEPVAEQVSQLVILHEKGEEGAAMPPLEKPIASVKAAVTNLATIGHEQVKTTKDEVLKLDTPHAIQKLEIASDSLVEAAKILSSDNFSKIGREKLISGARGILQGTSDLLLVFDAAEVKRLCHVCQSVRDYVKISEVVQQMEDLITFVKNLTPGLTSMSKLVTQRSNDLTNSSHAQKLSVKVDSLKVHLPSLISSMKAYVTTFQENNQSGLESAQKNRQFYVKSLSNEITEIIHLLQLVSTDKDLVLEKADVTELPLLQSNIIKNAELAQQWINNPSEMSGTPAELAFYKSLSDIRSLGNKVQGVEGERLLKKYAQLLDKVQQYQEICKEVKADTPEAVALAQEIQQDFNELLSEVDASVKHLHEINEARNAIVSNTPIVKEWLMNPSAQSSPATTEAVSQIMNASKLIRAELAKDHNSSSKVEELTKLCEEIDGVMNEIVEHRQNGRGHLPEVRDLAKQTNDKIVQLNNVISSALSNPTELQSYESKINCVNKWLEDPDINDGGQGMLAASSIIANIYGLSSDVKSAELRSQMLLKANECHKLCKDLNELQRSGLGDSPQAYELANALKVKFAELKEITKDALVAKVVDEFSDTSVILKQLKDVANSAKDMPNRDTEFDEAALALQKHSTEIAVVAQQAVAVSDLGVEEKLERVKTSNQKIAALTPQVVNAGKVVLSFPENKQAQENFKALTDEWMETVDGLTEQVDNAVDVSKFIEISEEGIKLENEKCVTAMHENESEIALSAARNIARHAHRVMMAGKREVDNTEEDVYVNLVGNGLSKISNSLPPMINATREYAQNPSSEEAQAEVEAKNNDLIQAITGIKETVESRITEEKVRSLELHQEEVLDAPPPCPPLPEEEELPARPPLPEEEDFPEEDEEDEHEMMHAARELHEETAKWEVKGNDIISAAKQMALLMAKMSRLVRDEGGKKSEMISCAKEIAKGSNAVTELSLAIADKCTDKRIKNDMRRTLDKIPTISTQLRILSTVKAASLGDRSDMSKEEEDAAEQATEMLVLNAQNLMMSVKEAVRYAEAASIRIRTDMVGTVRWVRK